MNQISKIDERTVVFGSLVSAMEQASVYAAQSKAANTRATYASAWRAYVAWCERWGVEPANNTPREVALYLTERAETLSASSMRVALAAIRAAHRLAGSPINMEDPFLSRVVEGIQRKRGVRPQRKATPATPDVLRRLLTGIPPHEVPFGARDRAMLLLQFGAALRNGELAGLAIGDVTIEPGKGLVVLIRRSKTDQRGEGQEISVAGNPSDPEFCPAVALARWLAHRGTTTPEAPLFCRIAKGGRVTGQGLCNRSVVRTIKLAAQRAGLDPSLYSGHSLRRGFMTAASKAGTSLAQLMRHSRHKQHEVALGYIEAAGRWEDNVSARVWNGG
jgi:site-specific recombinase XerD